MKRCNECDKELDSDSKICPNCGNPINNSYDNYLYNYQGNLKQRAITFVIIMVIILLLVVIATFAYFTATSAS